VTGVTKAKAESLATGVFTPDVSADDCAQTRNVQKRDKTNRNARLIDNPLITSAQDNVAFCYFIIPILFLNIFTAIASNITPKNLRTTAMPAGPNIRSRKLTDRSVI